MKAISNETKKKKKTQNYDKYQRQSKRFRYSTVNTDI